MLFPLSRRSPRFFLISTISVCIACVRSSILPSMTSGESAMSVISLFILAERRQTDRHAQLFEFIDDVRRQLSIEGKPDHRHRSLPGRLEDSEDADQEVAPGHGEHAGIEEVS